MTSRDRVIASIKRSGCDRLPIKHLAVTAVDEALMHHFAISDRDELLDLIGDDFREIYADYTGPIFDDLNSEHGIISGRVWRAGLCRELKVKRYPLSEITTYEEIRELPEADNNWFNYSKIKERCLKYKDYARIFGYCEMDFINNIAMLRGDEQALVDIGLRDPLFLELIDNKFRFVFQHIHNALEAADGEIDIVHFGEDLGSQRGLLISQKTFDELFAEKYAKVFELVHSYNAKTMMHCCGSVRELIPRLTDLGLDILDVIQTNAAGMEISGLKKDFADKIIFAGTMCVQKLLPFGTPEEIRSEVLERQKLFPDGGLIIGPSHQIQVDTPIENILEMYRCAGGLTNFRMRGDK